MKKIVLPAIAILVIVLSGIWYFKGKSYSPVIEPEEVPFATASFICDGGKTIDVSYFGTGEPPVSEPGEPPVPTGWARVVLSDGRTIDLDQTISASGARFATENEGFIFWNKGEEATIYEGGEEAAFRNCRTSGEEAVFCTMDAKVCPDGSFVGRQGPNCEFASCPGE